MEASEKWGTAVGGGAECGEKPSPALQPGYPGGEGAVDRGRGRGSREEVGRVGAGAENRGF